MLIYKTNFFRQVWENPHKIFFFYDIALIGLGLNISVMLYISVYLPFVKRIQGDFETHSP